MHNFFKRPFTFLGYFFISASLLTVVVRSCAIEAFETFKYRSFLAPSGQVFDKNKEKFSFAAMSDSGAMDEVMERVIRKITKSDAKFVLYLGDLVKYRNPSQYQWIADELDEELEGLPFFAIPGNHDITNKENIVDRSYYEAIFGQPYYWFSYGNVLFIGLDSSTGTIDDAQFKWLKTVLDTFRSNYKHCIIYMHIPPINPDGGNYKSINDKARVRFAKIIKDKNISLILSGHLHDYKQSNFAGVPMIITPSSGQEIRSEKPQFGWVRVKVSDGGIKAQDLYYDKPLKFKKDVLEFFFSGAVVKKEIIIFSLITFALGCILLFFARRHKE